MRHILSIVTLAATVTAWLVVVGVPGTAAPPTFLHNPDPDPSDRFGEAVAFDGTTAVVGAPRDNSGADQAGSVYVFERAADGTWGPPTHLPNPDPGVQDWFGASVAIAGDFLVVGAPNDEGVGAVHVYTRDGDGWSLQQSIPHPDPTGNDQFGFSVDLDVGAGYLVAGAPAYDSPSAPTGAEAAAATFPNDGAVFLYVYDPGVGYVDSGVILNPEPAIDAGFGRGVAIDGETIVSGAAGQGRAYLFDGVTPVATLLDPVGEAGNHFGWGVAIDGDTLVVGAPRTQVDGVPHAGAIHIYTRESGSWGTATTHRNPDTSGSEFGGQFGRTVAADGDVVLGGAFSNSPAGVEFAGAAFAFVREAGAWPLATTFTHPDVQPDEGFGIAVALSGRAALIGASLDEVDGISSGSVRVDGVNRAPTAADDTTTTDQERAVRIDVLANDSDPDDDPLTVVSAAGSSHGTVEVDGSALVYTPEDGFLGADTFTYTMRDDPPEGTGRLATADVTVAVTDPATKVTRIAGDNRILTAIEVSRFQFGDDGAEAVVVAREDQFADALAGVPFAVQEKAPLLLTETDELHPAVAAEIRRVLRSGGIVHVLGGTAAVSTEVTAALADLGHPVERTWGETRYETAAAIADALDRVDVVLLATGTNFADALAGGAAATRAFGAVLLTRDDQPHQATTDALARLAPGRTVALGGPAAAAYPAAESFVGTDRIDTALRTAREFFTDPTVVGIARQDAFPDALAGATHIAKFGGPILLTPTDRLDDRVRDYLEDHAAAVDVAFVYGGTAAVATGTAQAAASALEV